MVHQGYNGDDSAPPSAQKVRRTPYGQQDKQSAFTRDANPTVSVISVNYIPQCMPVIRFFPLVTDYPWEKIWWCSCISYDQQGWFLIYLTPIIHVSRTVEMLQTLSWWSKVTSLSLFPCICFDYYLEKLLSISWRKKTSSYAKVFRHVYVL